tara:strand:- start:167 stop:424 length:258 start_codon:yes stop_codon:yes gene_type:complete
MVEQGQRSWVQTFGVCVEWVSVIAILLLYFVVESASGKDSIFIALFLCYFWAGQFTASRDGTSYRVLSGVFMFVALAGLGVVLWW